MADDFETRLHMLMIAALAGDAPAYRQLLEAAAERLRAYFGRRLGPASADVEDLVQETLIALHRRRGSYDRSLRFTAWLHGIARYKLIDLYRRRGLVRTLPVECIEDFVGDDGMAATLAAVDVETLLAALPASQRAAVRLTRIAGYSAAEAAALTGQSPSAVKVGAHRAVKRLRALVGGERE